LARPATRDLGRRRAVGSGSPLGCLRRNRSAARELVSSPRQVGARYGCRRAGPGDRQGKGPRSHESAAAASRDDQREGALGGKGAVAVRGRARSPRPPPGARRRAGPQRYLGRYVHKTALSNSAIVAYSDDSVTFRYRDGRNHQLKTMTLPPYEFLRRFLQHVATARISPSPELRAIARQPSHHLAQAATDAAATEDCGL